MNDFPYQPVERDRHAERARAEKIPGYTEAREELAKRKALEAGQPFTAPINTTP